MTQARVILLRLVTSANCGAGEGTAVVDRPTLMEPITRLPCLPGSTIKGIWRSQLGINDAVPVHGIGDDDADGQPAKASAAQLGEGALLFLPVPLAGGSRFWALVAMNFARLLAWQSEIELSREAKALLHRIENERQPEILINAPDQPSQPEFLEVRQGCVIRNTVHRESRGRSELLEAVNRITPGGWATKGGGTLAIVSTTLMRQLAFSSLDRRSSTAISKTGTARDGSLRRTELLPEGTVFTSLTTAQQEPSWPTRLLIGGGEALGWGWVELAAPGQG